MRQLLTLTLLFPLLFGGCDSLVDQLDPTPRQTSVTGEWAYAGGTSQSSSPRNDAYTFEVSGTGTPITLTLESEEIDGGLYVFDSLGERVQFQTGRRSITLNLTLDSGSYRVVACGERGRPSRYTLSGTGLERGFSRITPSELDTDGQAFIVSGGSSVDSPRNPTFTFEVTDQNTWVDLVAESDDGDIGLYLFDPLGRRVGFQTGRRSPSLLDRLSPGTHTAVITGARSLIGDADLNVVGAVRSLRRVSFQTLTRRHNVTPSSPLRYAFTVTEPSVVDVAAESAQGDIRLELLDSTDRRIDFRTGRSPWFTEEVNPGSYTAVVRPNSSNSGSLTVDLTVIGKVRE